MSELVNYWAPNTADPSSSRSTIPRRSTDELGYFLTKASVTSMDFEELFDRATGDYVAYLDPPYFHKGGDLYHYGFAKADHIRLSECLKRQRRWVLTYDDCPEIRATYGWAHIIQYPAKYSINTIRHKNELMIGPPSSSMRRTSF